MLNGEGFGQPGMNEEVINQPEIKEKEGKPVDILMVDDLEAAQENLKNAAEEKNAANNNEEGEIKLKTSKDLKTALEELEELSHKEGAKVVISDLMFPNETGSNDKSEGIAVFKEICDYYGIKADGLFEIINQKKEGYEEAIKEAEVLESPYIEQLNEITHDPERSKELLKELFKPETRYMNVDEIQFYCRSLEEKFQLQMSNNILSQHSFREKMIEVRENYQKSGIQKMLYEKYKCRNIYSAMSESDWLVEKLGFFGEYINKGQISEQFSEKAKREIDVDEIKDGLATLFLQDQSYQPLGVRVMQKANELGIPSIMVTSHHTVGQHFANLAGRYLGDTDICNGEILTDIKFTRGGSIDEMQRKGANSDVFKIAKMGDGIESAETEEEIKERKSDLKDVWKMVLDRAYAKAVEKEGR